MRSMYGYVRYDFPERQWCQCREGLHTLPKIMFDQFFKEAVVFQIGGVFFTAVGTFLREGMKPSPALGKCNFGVMPAYDYFP